MDQDADDVADVETAVLVELTADEGGLPADERRGRDDGEKSKEKSDRKCDSTALEGHEFQSLRASQSFLTRLYSPSKERSGALAPAARSLTIVSESLPFRSITVRTADGVPYMTTAPV